jgi:hypothetical protein
MLILYFIEQGRFLTTCLTHKFFKEDNNTRKLFRAVRKNAEGDY